MDYTCKYFLRTYIKQVLGTSLIHRSDYTSNIKYIKSARANITRKPSEMFVYLTSREFGSLRLNIKPAFSGVRHIFVGTRNENRIKFRVSQSACRDTELVSSISYFTARSRKWPSVPVVSPILFGLSPIKRLAARALAIHLNYRVLMCYKMKVLFERERVN